MLGFSRETELRNVEILRNWLAQLWELVVLKFAGQASRLEILVLDSMLQP